MSAHEIVQSRLGVNPEIIERFCRKWGIRELSLFGSSVGDDFGPESDIDLLVVFEDPSRSFGPWMGELLEMEEELRTIFGRPVDLVMRDSVERSPNYIRRRAILASVVPLYVA